MERMATDDPKKSVSRLASLIADFCNKIGTSRTSQDVRLESAKWGKADLDQVAVTNRNFMSTRPSKITKQPNRARRSV